MANDQKTKTKADDKTAAPAAAGLFTVDKGADYKEAETVNKPVKFWQKSYIDEKTQREEPNSIRGYVCKLFRVPEGFGTSENDNGELKQRMAAFVLLTEPTHVKTLDGKEETAQPGEQVWMDILHANTAVVLAASPKAIDPSTGLPTGVVEMRVEALYKKKFPATDGSDDTWQAWNMKVYGGWKQAAQDAKTHRRGGYRALTVDQIQANAHLFEYPSILKLEDALEIVDARERAEREALLNGNATSDAPPLLAAPERPALPAQASPSSN